MSIIPSGMTIKQYFERDAQRKKRRALVQKFNAKVSGKAVQTDRTTVRAQLDHLTSLYVRRRDRAVYAGLCLICVTKRNLGLLDRAPEPITLAYHVVPRGDDMTRWHLQNVIGACSLCNFGEKQSRMRASTRATYRIIHVQLIGVAAMDELERLSTQKAHFSTADLIAMRDELKSKLEGIK